MNRLIQKYTPEFLQIKLLVLVVYIILELYYGLIITKTHPHLGFLFDFNILKFIVTKFLFVGLLLLSWQLFGKSKFLYAVFLLLIFFFYIPNAILFSFSNYSLPPFICTTFFVSFFVTSTYLIFKIPAFDTFKKYSGPFLIILSLLLLFPLVYKFRSSFNLNTLLLKDIYTTRALFSDQLKGYLAYLYHIEVKTLLPVALIFFMINKKPIYIAMYLIILLYLYVISGNKMVYFTSGLLLFFYYLGKDYTDKLRLFLLCTIALFVLFPLIDFLVLKRPQPLLIGTFVNRFLFIPALLTQWYFDFFKDHPFYFAESNFFSSFVKSPYDMPVGFLLTKIHWNEPTVYANNGIVSDGFMNLGYVGVVLFSAIFSLLFSFFNSLKLNIGYFGLFFAYIYVFLSAPFLSCFITGGILLFIPIAIFVLRSNSSK